MKTNPARGMRDFLPADVRRREYVIRVVKEVYERYGFEPLETPAVENIETLMGKYGEEGNQLIFKILKRGEHEKTGEADLALRYDLTVPLARVVAEYKNTLPKFFKRYQIQPVWRADRPARGRFREFYQCDVDILGSRSMIVEAELCAAVSDVLTELGFTDFTFWINHRQLLAGVLDRLGVEAATQGEFLVVLDKIDKIGPEEGAKEFTRRGISESAWKGMIDIWADLKAITTEIKRAPHSIDSVGAFLNRAVLDYLADFVSGHPAALKAIDDLRSLLEMSSHTSAGPHLRVDISLARGLSYYTGTIMEINVPDLAGSLGGGGRYDNLVGMFSGQDVPACGFSLGLERIIVVMTEKNMFPADAISAPADIMVTIWNEEGIPDSLKLANDLRKRIDPVTKKQLRVDVYPVVDKIAKQLKYASSRGIPLVAIIGEAEKAESKVALKDMRSGEQVIVSIDQILERVSFR